MTIGVVEEVGGGLYAYADVRVRGPTGGEIPVSALVDTGFNAYVSLPASMVEQLRLPPLGTENVVLANADTETVEMFLGQVRWRRRRRYLPVHQIGDEPSAGTALLRQFNLSIDFLPNGDVRVSSITKPTVRT